VVTKIRQIGQIQTNSYTYTSMTRIRCGTLRAASDGYYAGRERQLPVLREPKWHPFDWISLWRVVFAAPDVRSAISLQHSWQILLVWSRSLTGSWPWGRLGWLCSVFTVHPTFAWDWCSTQRNKTRGQSNLTKSASWGPIPRLGVTSGGRNLYQWIPGIGVPISVP